MKKAIVMAIAVGLGLATLLLIMRALKGTPVQAAPIRPPQSTRLLYSPGNCTVTSTLDSGPGTLRNCMAQLVIGDVITFSADTFPLANPVTIYLTNPLPDIITNSVTIDGSNAGVILDGSGTPEGTNGLVIDGSSNVTIKGLQILNFPSNGIELRDAGYNVISQTVTTVQAASTAVSSTFSIGNPYPGEQLVEVTIDATDVPAGCEVRLDLNGLFTRWQSLGRYSLSGATVVTGTTQIAIPGGGEAIIGGLPLQGEELIEVVIEVSGLNGRYGWIDISERIGGDPLGGLSIHVVGHHEFFLPILLYNNQ